MDAHEAASTPENIQRLYKFYGSTEIWECMGYSRTGNTVKFARFGFPNGRLAQISKYVHPDTTVDMIPE